LTTGGLSKLTRSLLVISDKFSNHTKPTDSGIIQSGIILFFVKDEDRTSIYLMHNDFYLMINYEVVFWQPGGHSPEKPG